MKKSIEFSQNEIYNLFETDSRSCKKTWFTFISLQKLTSQECNNFQLFHLGKITRNYYTPVTYNIGNYIIKPPSERCIVIIIILKTSFCSFKAGPLTFLPKDH